MANHDLQDWFALIGDLARELDQIGVNIVVLGPPPMFKFEDIRACDPAEVLSCSIARDPQRALVERVLDDMRALETAHDNVAVLDVFDVFCPSVAPICSPLREGVFTFRDRDHFNVFGAELLMPHLQETLSGFND